MKSVYALAIGILVSVSAIAFFKGEGRILQLFANKGAVDPQNDSAGLKKKKPVKVSKKNPKKRLSAAQTSDWSSYLVAPIISATKTVDKTTDAVSGNVLSYIVTISNTGTADATDLTFTDNIDPNTTLVPGSLKTSPIAFDDAYTALGNVGISVPAANGILANDEQGTNPQATFLAVTNAATTQGGTITIAADGSFTYTPAAGFTGDDTYTYTLSNDAGSSSGTVTISVSGMIWFVNYNSAAATADGRLNTPFKTVAAFQTVNDGAGLHPKASQNIFIHESVTAYDGNITLLNGQKLIGQDATASLASITGYTSYTYSTSLLPAMNSGNATVTNLTATGATNVVALNGGSSGTYAIRGLTIGNKITGSGIAGSSFGTLTVSETNITGTGQALTLTSGTLSATFAGILSSSGVNAISLTSIAGTLTIAGGTLTGSTGTPFNVNGGTVGITYNGNITQAANAAMVSVAGSHTGTITFQTGTLSATNGTGLQFSAANGTYNFNGTTTLNGGDAGVDILGTSLGSFTFSANTSITNPSGTAFAVGAAAFSTGGSGSVTYNGAITKTSAGRAIEIQNKTGGTILFAGKVTSTTNGTGINLLSNSGATIDFTGGLDLSTGGNTAFTATGGGTISAMQNNNTIVNTITTTTGLGVSVANTTIGSGGLTFRSINVNGASKAVSLNTTGSGGFTITGTGTTSGSGGTIQNISTRGLEFIGANNISINYLNLTNANTTDGASTCDDNGNSGCNAAIYISTATGVALNNLNVTTTAQQGLNLNGVTNLTINNCTIQGNGNSVQEGALKARNILGTSSITNSLFKNSAYRIAHIINTSGLADLTIEGCTFTNEAFDPSSPAGMLKQDCFEMRTQSTANATVVIKNSTFTRAGSYGIQLAAEGSSTMTPKITNCTVDRGGQQMAGIAASADGPGAVMNANIDGNPLIQSSKEVAVNVFSGLQGTMQATVRNNTSPTGSIQGGNNADVNPFANVFIHAIQQSNGKVLMTNNKVEYTDEEAIQLATHDGTTNTLSATVDGNTVITQNTAAHPSLFGIRVLSNSLSGTASPTCANIKNNALTLSGAAAPPLPYTFEVETGAASSQINLQSNSGTNETNIANLWVNNGNLPTNTALVLEQKTPGSIINYGGVTCPQPTNTAVVPAAIARIAAAEETTVLALTDVPLLNASDIILPEPDDSSKEENVLVKSEENNLALSANNEAAASITQSITETTTPQNITLSGINLPAAKSLTIKFQVTVNNGLATSVCSVSNQGSVSGTGLTTVLTDNDANTGNGVNPTVTTILDETDPVVNNCPSTVTVQTGAGNATCSQSATWTEPTATDNCSGTLTYFSRSHAPGSTFASGTTEVTYIFKDAAGNEVSCKFNVVVQDNTAPAISGCPSSPITVQTGAGNTTCTQTATWTEPTATDNCGNTLNYFSRSHAPGATFSKETTEVTYVFKDAAGNENTCSFNVVVEDNTPPVISGCPSNITVQTGAGNTTCTKTVSWTEPTATDNCGAITIWFSRSHAPGSTFSKGTTTVSYVFKDAAGNSGTCSFDVIVEDNTPPVLTCPDNVVAVESPSGSGTATVNYPAATATDNCSGVGTIQYSKASGSSFPVGQTTVNVSVTDAAGNPASCSFTVTVNPACQITPPVNVVANATSGQCGAIVTYNAATTTGNCGTLSYSEASGTLFPVGETTVTVSSLSTGQSSSFTVTVNDNQDPVITTCPGNIAVNTDAGACTALIPVADIDKAVATDNCPTGLTVRYFLHYGTGNQQQITGAQSFDKGTTTVTVEAKDATGNKATCTFTVTVTDNEKPQFTSCTQNITVDAQESGCAATVSFGTINTAVAMDNCPAGLTVKYYLNYGTESQQLITANRSFSGNTTVTAEAKDASGNIKTCSFTVTVTPTADLSITKTALPVSPVVAGTNVTYTLTVNNTATCDASNVSLSDVLPSGTTFVSLTAPAGWNATTPAAGANGTVTATKTSLAASGSATFTLVVKVNSDATGTVSNTATVTSETQDLDASNNNATADVTLISQADLRITKTASPANPQAGTNLTYTLTVVNNGPSDASSVSLSDALPSGTTFVSLTAPAGWNATTPAAGANGTVTATKTSLAASSGAQTFTLVVLIAANTAHNTLLTNTAYVSSNTVDPVPGNNSATDNTTVINCELTCPADITVNTGANSTVCGANVAFTATSTAGCGTITYTTAAGTIVSGAFFPVGTTQVTATASTGQSCTFNVTVVDNTPPVVTGFDESTLMLWPPNHKLVKVATYTATDNCAIQNLVVNVVSNEPENGTGDGDRSPDYVIDYTNKAIWVRAERGNKKEQRTYDITITVTDVNGKITTKTKRVVIAHNITGPVTGTSFKVGSTVAFSGVFWDKPGNKHAANWLIDGSTTAKATVTEPSGTKNGKVSGSYKFATAGIYKLQMNVVDQNKVTSYANMNEDMEAIVVIYDPNGGYIYGGGYFPSPAGALKADPTATGKANFGFTANYYKNATLPKGEAQFEFKVGEFEYNAVNLEYLSVAGYKAVIRGSGKITGGQSGIQFMLYVIDGALDKTGVDKIRLKIFNKNTGEVYYDSEPGASDAANPRTPVGAGSTVVISGTPVAPTSMKVDERYVQEEATEPKLQLTALPNPTTTQFTVQLRGGSGEPVNLRVMDAVGRAVEARSKMATNNTLQIGAAYRPGIYFVEAVQGKQRVTLKLIKQSD